MSNKLEMRRGPIVNKDEFPRLINRYTIFLREKGIRGKDLNRAVARAETTIYDGNPGATADSVARLQEIINPRH